MTSGGSMTIRSATPRDADRSAVSPSAGKEVLFSLDGIDLDGCVSTREQIAAVNPHRGEMALLDQIVWMSEDIQQSVALWKVKPTEFWVPGHFPNRPMLPGVLMVEAGAQLSVYLFGCARENRLLAAFTRIEHAIFRSSVEPGDEFLILAQQVKMLSRGFVTDIQGIVDDRIVFEARIAGIDVTGRK